MRLALAVVLAALAAAAPAASASPPTALQRVAAGIEIALAAGRLTPTEAAGYRAGLERARAELRALPPLRAALLRAVLGDLAAQWRSYTAPRALVLFSTLTVNEDWLAAHALSAPRPDLTGVDGAVYRFFAGHGYVFHPLANAAALNGLAAKGDLAGTRHLAQALVARATRSGKALVWEYDFPFASGRPPWTSGMAQAVMAQALARAGDVLSDPSLLHAAAAAYAALPQLLARGAPATPWVALYSFDRTPVLNAQLQAALSVDEYAAITGDAAAAAFAGRLEEAAKAALPRFDTGSWSLYSLRGDESSLDYHAYVIALLRKLATRTGDPSWGEVADRFQAYESQPPVIRLGSPPPTVYPRPADGFRDDARFRFWLSKRSRVTLLVAGQKITATLPRGSHTLAWPAQAAAPGQYRPYLTAVGPAGVRAEEALPPVTVAPAPGPPPVEVSVSPPATLSWRSTAAGTPWLRLRIRLVGAGVRMLDLGRRRLAGTRRLRLPPGRWHATLLASNSAGRTSSRSLGYLPR